MDRDEMVRVLRPFEAEGLEYVLISAAAMGVHGVIRATEDLDVVVRASPENIERLRRALRQVYDRDPNVEQITDDDLLGEYPAVRYYPPSGDLHFDILTRLGEAIAYESVERETKDVAGTKVVVATPKALYRMKKDTIRPLDRQNAAALREPVRPGGNVKGRVERFRSIEEMGRARIVSDPRDGFERFARHCARYWAIAPRQYPRGVFKFRSIEEAQAARERVAAAQRARG